MIKSHLKTIKQDQLEDQWIEKKIKILSNLEPKIGEKEKNSVLKWFKMHEDILFKRGEVDNPGFKLCVPKKQVQGLVRQQHHDIGHFGAAKTFNHMSREFFWPRMRKHIRQIVAACTLCQKTKVSTGSHGTNNSVLTKTLGEIVCIDLMGPLPPSRFGATQLVAVVDAFSKYTRLYALKNGTTRNILRCLEKDYFVKVQKPAAILSDNGTQFVSKLWEKSLREHGIVVKHTSTYFPQGNTTERVNREIGRLLRAWCCEKHTRWAYMLKEVEHCLNNVVHESTGFTPNYLHFGFTEIK